MRKENGAKLKEIDEAMKALLESIRKAGAADDFYSQEELRGRIEYLKNLIDNQNREPAKK